jgi:hypothetical protein
MPIKKYRMQLTDCVYESLLTEMFRNSSFPAKPTQLFHFFNIILMCGKLRKHTLVGVRL